MLLDSLDMYYIETSVHHACQFYLISFRVVHGCEASGSMQACHAASPGSIPSRDKFPRWDFFRGFSSPIRQMSGNFKTIRSLISFGHHNHPFIFALWEWMVAWIVRIVFHVCGVSEVAPALSWCLIPGGPPCPYLVKTGCMRSKVNFHSRQVVAI